MPPPQEKKGHPGQTLGISCPEEALQVTGTEAGRGPTTSPSLLLHELPAGHSSPLYLRVHLFLQTHSLPRAFPAPTT